MSRRRHVYRMEKPPGVRVIEACRDPMVKGVRLSASERNRLEAEEFERRFAQVIYRGVEGLGLRR